MKIQHLIAAIVCVVTHCCSTHVVAQTEFKGAAMVPSSPTSADTITYVRFEPRRFCTRIEPRHRVSMQNNNITITFGAWDTNSILIFPGPPDLGTRVVDLVDVGRLPEGDYTLTTVGAQCTIRYSNEVSPPDINKVPFKVTDGLHKNPRARPNEFPTIDYSGHWWDEGDSGWGLFLWQDSAHNVLAAWFTYTADGKPAWYVFQPTWGYYVRTRTVDVWQTSKPPGTTVPPTGATKLNTVGTASLQFYFGEISQGSGLTTVEQLAKFTYKLGDAATQTRTLKRFRAQ